MSVSLQNRIERFLNVYLDNLPDRFPTETDNVVLQTHRDFWRALILTYADRYG
jgi:hypothetical protein